MIIIQKWGGSRLKSALNFSDILAEVEKVFNQDNYFIIVVSAYKGITDQLDEKYQKLTNQKKDQKLVKGELKVAHDLKRYFKWNHYKSIVLNAKTMPIITDETFGDANIIFMSKKKINEMFGKCRIVIIPGFQGVTPQKKWTTLGRGGGDYTALYLASMFGNAKCMLYKDVDGIYVDGKKQTILTIDNLIALNQQGSGVVALKATLLAKEKGLNFGVGYNDDKKTRIENK